MFSSLMCLALSIYYEAGNQDRVGKLAVGHVIMNRVESVKYPDNICEVIKQHRQFSFYSDGKPERIPSKRNRQEFKAWEESYLLASFLLSEGSYGEHMEDITGGAMHYHANYVEPEWVNGERVEIGSHIFYSQID